MMLRKIMHHPRGGDPLTILSSLLNYLGEPGQTLIIAQDSSPDPLPALWASGIKHFLSLEDPVKAVELTGLINNPALVILGNQFSALFSGGLDGVDAVFIEKLFTGSSPEYLELLEDVFPSMLSESITRIDIDASSIECVAASLPSQRLARRLPRYLKGAPPEAFTYVEEARKLGLGLMDMTAYTLGKCLEKNSDKILFIGLSEWGLLISLPRWSR